MVLVHILLDSVHSRSFHYVTLKLCNAYLSRELEIIIHFEHNVNIMIIISPHWLSNEQSIVMVKVLTGQLCLTLCNSMDCSLPGSSVSGLLQAKILGGLPFPSPGDLPDKNQTQVSRVAGRFFIL